MADIKHSIVIAAPGERVRSLVSSAAGLSEWWAADSLDADGGVELGFFNRSTVYRLRPELQSTREVLWRCETGDEWKETLIAFEIRANGAATTLRFAHKGWANETDYFTMCNTTWGALLYRLKAAAEGKAPGPLFSQSGLNA